MRAALALQPQTLWFVASERKAGVLRENLLGAGEDPARVAAIVAPAGEPIGAQTPEEIALAVLATVVAARRAAVDAYSAQYSGAWFGAAIDDDILGVAGQADVVAGYLTVVILWT